MSSPGSNDVDKVAVRPMRFGDCATVARLCGQLGYPATPAEVEQRFKRIAGRTEAAVFVAESSDHRVLGWVHVCGTDTVVSDAQAEVWGLVVDAGVRGQGLGRRLLTAAEGWATGKGFSVMRVRSNTVRVEARRFYERVGYSVIKTQNTFHKMLVRDGPTAE